MSNKAPADAQPAASQKTDDEPTKSGLTDTDRTVTLHGNRPPYEVLTQRERKLILISIVASRFLAVLDATIVAVSLPKMLADLGDAQYLSWVVASYLLTNAAILPLTGRLSDIVGRRSVYLWSLLIFLASSAACGAANGIWFIIIARLIQGIGGGGLNAMTMIIAGDITPPQGRAANMAMLGSTAGLAAIAGPVFGGVLTDYVSWRAVFYINLPFGGISAALALYSMRNFEVPTKRLAVDWIGALLSFAGTACLVLFVTWGGDKQVGYPWDSGVIIGLIVATAVISGVFLIQEYRHSLPVMQLQLHLIRNVWTSFAVFFLGYGTMLTTVTYGAVYFQHVVGDSAIISGLKTFGFVLGFMITARLCGKFQFRVKRAGLPMGSAGVMLSIGTGLLSRLTADTNYGYIFVALLILGIGMGWIIPGCGTIVQMSVMQKDISVSMSNLSFDGYLGGCICVTIAGSIFNKKLESSLAEHNNFKVAGAEAIAACFFFAVWPALICGLIGFLVQPINAPPAHPKAAEVPAANDEQTKPVSQEPAMEAQV